MYFWDKHKTITGYYELLSAEVCDRYGLTQMEYDIRMFLHNNPQHNTAAEIVKVRKSTKSHVSTSLKNLENEGLIERIQSEDNKKHIEIVLLDKAELIAGIVWMIAGVNVARLGVISYLNAESDLGRLAYSRRDLLLFSIWGLAQRWHQRELFLPEIICYQKYSFCSYWYRDNYFIFNFGKYLWIPYDKDGCGYYYFIWLLSSSNVIQ